MSNSNQQQNRLILNWMKKNSGEFILTAIINHSSEFVLDFVSIMPGIPKAKVKSRIVLTPQHAKDY
jgi:hypothetical protein